MTILNLCKYFVHIIFRIRKFQNKHIKKFANHTDNCKILELGSGKKYKNYYSAKKFFNNSNYFIQSDIEKEYGHRIIDATNMNFNNEFDIVLCINVLEHVYDFKKAIDNIYKSLKYNGVAIISVPVIYPLHDEPNDYWRFTKHSLKNLLKKFSLINIHYSGIKKFPFAYYMEAKK